MYIIVVGGGKVGFHLAKELVETPASHEVLLIEQDPARALEIGDQLGDIVLPGDGCEATVLDKAGTERADMFLAVTGDDEDNLVACQVAKRRFNVPRTIARINNPDNEPFFRKLDVDITVSATSAIMAHIEQELPTHQMVRWGNLPRGLEIVEIKIPDESRIVGARIGDVLLPQQSMIILVIDDAGVSKIPSADTVVRAGDEVVAVTLHESEDALREALMRPAAVRSF